MNIFITGVAGFLGSHLAKFYIEKGFNVSGNDTLIGGYEDSIHPKVNFSKIECENFEKMKNLLKNQDVVIHCAAYAHEGLSVFSPHTICSNIVSGSTSVFSAAIENKVKRIVHCSSMARYGKIQQPFNEDDAPHPVDPYGIAKLASENILKNLCEVHGTEFNIAVPHNIIGTHQRYDDPFRNVASIMINLILQGRQPVIYGDGEQMRSFSDVRECVYCIDKLATDKNIKGEIVNIGPEGNYISINKLYEIISNQLQFNKEPIYYPDRPKEVKYSNCSQAKAERLLGYKQIYSLDESISEMIKYIKERGTRDFLYSYDIEIDNHLTPKTWKDKIF